jgi:hypothetical protein
MDSSTSTARLPVVLTLALAMSGPIAGGALALEEAQDEKERLEACERDLCAILVKRTATGSDLQCNLQKTWAGTKIKQGVEEKKLSWSLGDLRCAVRLEAKQQDLVDALTKPQFELKLATHTVRCEVEREKEVTQVSVALTPRFQFKDGKAAKVWLGLGEVQAPAVVKGAIWTAAQLEDTFGVVHGDLIKEINRFVYERCPKRVAQ